MALQTKEGALHLATWAGPGTSKRAGEVGVSGGALKTGELPEGVWEALPWEKAWCVLGIVRSPKSL